MSRGPTAAELDTAPDFDLEYLFDDPQNPSEVTITTTDTEQSVTQWVTVDRSTAVPLEEVR
jgi:hypothetical protein